MKGPRRRRIIIEEGDETLVTYGGGILIDEFIHRLSLPEIIDSTVKVKERERGFTESEHVLSLAVTMITGGECLDDLLNLREEDGFRTVWSHGGIPHPTTMGDFLRRFNLGHIRQLESVLTQAFRKVYSGTERLATITLDIDSTLDEVHGSKKQGARWAYTGIKALHPLMCFIGENGDWLHSRLRAGNMYTSDGAVSFVRESYHKVEGLAESIATRMDSGFYRSDVVEECERLGIGFSITADQTAPVMAHVESLAEETWKPIDKDVWVNEFSYQPTRWSKACRFLVRRERLPEKEQVSLLDAIPYRYHVIVTNRTDPIEELVPFHLRRATMENFIKETKHGLSLDRFPCQEFHANWTYLTVGMLAYNIVNWIKRLALPSLHKKKLLKALRYRFFNVAARVVQHSRYTILRFAKGMRRFGDILHAYRRIMGLEFA